MSDALALFLDPDETATPDQTALDWLRDRGVAIDAITSPWGVRVARVVFDGARYAPAPRVGSFAFIFAIIDGDIIDAAAWEPKTGKIASRFGIGALLGEGQIGRDQLGTMGRALPVWRSPLEWLRDGRKGVVIVDAQRAAHVLAGATIKPEDDFHRRELKRLLRVPPPTFATSKAASSRQAVAA